MFEGTNWRLLLRLNWGLFFRGLAVAVSDLRANRRSALRPASTASVGDMLGKLASVSLAAQRQIQDNPGIVGATDDVADALRRLGVPHAADVENFLLRAPDIVDDLARWLPEAGWVLDETAPSPVDRNLPRGRV